MFHLGNREIVKIIFDASFLVALPTKKTPVSDQRELFQLRELKENSAGGGFDQ